MEKEKRNIKLIALDMDGTLLNGNHEVSSENQKAIRAAQEKNVKVMLCTGRWLQSCYSYADTLKLNTFLITSNGGEIWSESRSLLERHLHDAKTMEQMWTLGNELGIHMWLVSTDGVFHDKPPKDFSEYDWLKIGFHSEDRKKLKVVLDKLPTKDMLEITNSSLFNIEVNPIGVNKANALERVCKEMGITMNEVMAVGDSLNDIKMIERAGVGVAMGNAQDVVKESADYITETNENDGVAQAIEHFVLG